MKGVGDHKSCLEGSPVVELEGVEIRILGLEPLIRAKEAMGRPHDLETVRQLKAIAALQDRPSEA